MVMKIVKFVLTPSGLLLVAILMLIAGHFIFKKNYLNCFIIIKKHLECFKNKNGKYSFISIILYFVVPGLIALALVQIRELDDDIINILTIIISILTSMLFTMLTLILDMRKHVLSDVTYNANEAAISVKVLKETYYSIMFEILISIAILIMCFIELFSRVYSFCDSLIIYYLTFVMLLNLFMVLKRIFSVIHNDMKVQDR